MIFFFAKKKSFVNMKYLSQTVVFSKTQNELAVFPEQLLSAIADVKNPDMTRVVISLISVKRVNSDRTGLYSLKFKDDKLNAHVSYLRDPKGNICLAMVESLATLDIPPCAPDPEKVTPGEEDTYEVFNEGKQTADDKYIIDVNSVLFPRAPGAPGYAKELNEFFFKELVREFVANDIVINTKQDPFVLVLEPHDVDESDKPGRVTVTLEMSYDLVSKV